VRNGRADGRDSRDISGFNRWFTPPVRGTKEKRCTPCRDERQRPHDYSGY